MPKSLMIAIVLIAGAAGVYFRLTTLTLAKSSLFIVRSILIGTVFGLLLSRVAVDRTNSSGFRI